MIKAGMAFQRSLGLRDTRFTKAPRREITRNNLGNHVGEMLR
ncbi:MAG: hypothetical protein HW379_656 [Actinobacteria bacterium]|nr:hypothetical protein [Actinomycetota bacterium]